MKTFRTILWLALLACCLMAVNASAQKPDTDIWLTVGGEVSQTLKLTQSDLNKFARKSLTARDHDKKDHQYEGIALVEILQKAGVKFGTALRGKTLATYLLVEAADGYQAVFALPELDPPSSDRLILLADKQDGVALTSEVGPLKIIAPGDSQHSRWVRQVKSLTIMRAPAK